MKTLNQTQTQTVAGGLSQEQIDWLDAFFRQVGRSGPCFPEPTPDTL